MDNRREHSRIPLRIEIKISHPQIGEKIVVTKNFSEGGVFVLVEPSALPPVGEVVQGQVQGSKEECPTVPMKIVWADEDGLGLQYIVEDQ